MFVVGERVAHPRAVADPFAALVDDLAAVRPHQRYEAVVRGPGVTRRSRVEGVGDDVRDSVLHLPGAIEDVADDLRDPVGSETGFVEHVAPDVEPAHVESVGDRPHLALIGDTALHRVGVVLPVFPLPQAATTPVAAIACRNARRERTGVFRSSTNTSQPRARIAPATFRIIRRARRLSRRPGGPCPYPSNSGVPIMPARARRVGTR